MYIPVDKNLMNQWHGCSAMKNLKLELCGIRSTKLGMKIPKYNQWLIPLLSPQEGRGAGIIL